MTGTARRLAAAWALAAPLLAAAAGRAHASEVGDGPPLLPQAEVDLAPPVPLRPPIAVPAGGDLQAALDAARPGDTLLLDPGAVYQGPFVLPAKTGDDWIVVRTAAPDGVLPASGTRVGPPMEALLAVLQSATDTVVRTGPGAHHYRFVGLEIRPAPGVFLFDLVDLSGPKGRGPWTPHHLVFDRCWLHGDPAAGGRRGIALNARFVGVVDSTLSDFKEVGNDSQALCGWDGDGPFAIVNDDLQAAGENVMFGGSDPTTRGLVPADITVRRNHFAKPLTWKPDDPAYGGVPWSVKNLFELKNARRVLIEGNVFEFNWPQSQNGYAILFTVRDQDGTAPWSTVRDVTFRDNVVRHVSSGINVLGNDTVHPGGSRFARRILVVNNLFDDVGGPIWGGAGVLAQILSGAHGVVLDHNTAIQTGSFVLADGAPSPRPAITSNIALANQFGVIGSGTAPGLPTLRAYFPGALVAGNVIVGAPADRYPPGNFFPATLAEVGFAAPVSGDYSLLPSSPYRGRGADGRDPGADLVELRARLPQ